MALVGDILATAIWTLVPVGICIGMFFYSDDATVDGLLQRSFAIVFAGVISVIYRTNQESLTTQAQENQDKVRTLLRIVCHDIANPLSVSTSYFEMLKDEIREDQSDRTQKFIAKITKAHDVMTTLLEEVKSMEATSSGKMSLKLGPVSLTTVFSQLEDLFENKIEAKKLSLNVNYESLDSVYVISEPLTLQNQVFANLMTNAIKFSNTSGVIEIYAEAEGEVVCVHIRDHGVGIPDNILGVLFDPMSKTSRSGTSGEEGTGFGMPIVKAFMEQYGGAIRVESEEGSGTRVSLTFSGFVTNSSSIA